MKLLEAIVDKSKTVLPPSAASSPSCDARSAGCPCPQGPVKVGEGPVHVMETAADQMFNDMTPDMTARMPNTKAISS